MRVSDRQVKMAELPTLYEYYAGPSITAGLSDAQSHFTLNEKNITIYSGALHYFRVPQEYWRDRLRKLRAAGLNTVETYVPWNLHEPRPGEFDFGNGGSDFQEFLNIRKFLQIAQEEDLFAIVRPGPYICAEWDFGGLPSWLLRFDDLKIRTSDSKFLQHVSSYFTALFTIITSLQFTKGGPIIAFQIENEYGNTKKLDEPVDLDYLSTLKQYMLQCGVVELLFTSDTPSNGNSGALPNVLYTANFQNDTKRELDLLRTYQADKPAMVMEYWTGWFDHWTEQHHTRTNEEFSKVLLEILNFPASVNLYMFHGGTNWGFMNGANIHDSNTDNGGYIPDTSSYDYDAPLTESGDYTDKYYSLKKILEDHNTVKTLTPPQPPETPKFAYESVEITGQLSLNDLIGRVDDVTRTKRLLSMEQLATNNNSGQSYGYAVYRKTNLDIPSNSVLTINGRVCDTAMVLINGELKSKVLESVADMQNFGYWKAKDASLNLGNQEYKDATLDIVVENFGRSNFGKLDQFNQKKGLWQGNVSINGEPMFDWTIVPLEFKTKWNNDLLRWNQFENTVGPSLLKGILNVVEKKDTFIDMTGWTKGIVIVNGFVLSRYLKFGPQQAAYLPAPLLKMGKNEILIFEHFTPKNRIEFSASQIYLTME